MSLSQAVGQGKVIEHKGVAYHLAPPDHVQVIAAFGDHLRERALVEVDRVRASFGPVAGQMAMADYMAKGIAGEFDYGSLLWAASVAQPVNMKALLLFMLRVRQPDVTRAVAEAIFEQERERVQAAVYDYRPADEEGPGNGAAAAG